MPATRLLTQCWKRSGWWASVVLAAGLLGPAVTPAWAQPGSPDVRGTYQGSGSVTLSNCTNKAFNDLQPILTATINISSQSGQTFSGTMSGNLIPIPATVVATLTTGTVASDGQISDGSFIFSIMLGGSPITGNGTFTGQSQGNSLTLNINGTATSGETCTLKSTLPSNRFTTTLAAAVLPSSRSVEVNNTATAFATIVNAGATTGLSCRIVLPQGLPATFTFQTTDPATNQVNGPLNAPVDIPAGALQTFVIAFTPTSPFAPTDVQLSFQCANADPATVILGVNTLLLLASSVPVPDIVALAATINNDGIVNIPGQTGTGVFAVATVNLGISAMITVTADTGTGSPPVSILLCQTNAQGACLQAPASSVIAQINANATPTFGIFVTGAGTVRFDPANNRIFVRFRAGGVTSGATSVAARTQ